ncbi:hypothetical protein BDZ91DRAFT_741952, partial [Kalaharituber pfeilii]
MTVRPATLVFNTRRLTQLQSMNSEAVQYLFHAELKRTARVADQEPLIRRRKQVTWAKLPTPYRQFTPGMEARSKGIDAESAVNVRNAIPTTSISPALQSSAKTYRIGMMMKIYYHNRKPPGYLYYETFYPPTMAPTDPSFPTFGDVLIQAGLHPRLVTNRELADEAWELKAVAIGVDKVKRWLDEWDTTEQGWVTPGAVLHADDAIEWAALLRGIARKLFSGGSEQEGRMQQIIAVEV